MKRKFGLAFVLVMLGMLVFGVVNVSAAKNGIYTYSISGGKATITDRDTSVSGAITIPNINLLLCNKHHCYTVTTSFIPSDKPHLILNRHHFIVYS